MRYSSPSLTGKRLKKPSPVPGPSDTSFELALSPVAPPGPEFPLLVVEHRRGAPNAVQLTFGPKIAQSKSSVGLFGTIVNSSIPSSATGTFSQRL